MVAAQISFFLWPGKRFIIIISPPLRGNSNSIQLSKLLAIHWNLRFNHHLSFINSEISLQIMLIKAYYNSMSTAITLFTHSLIVFLAETRHVNIFFRWSKSLMQLPSTHMR